MTPRLITQRDLIRSCEERWRRQYARHLGSGDDKDQIWRRLRDTDLDRASTDDIEAIVGNGSWTRLVCDGCGDDTVTAVVEVGEKPNYESCTARLCADCLGEAMVLVEGFEDTHAHGAQGDPATPPVVRS